MLDCCSVSGYFVESWMLFDWFGEDLLAALFMIWSGIVCLIGLIFRIILIWNEWSREFCVNGDDYWGYIWTWIVVYSIWSLDWNLPFLVDLSLLQCWSWMMVSVLSKFLCHFALIIPEVLFFDLIVIHRGIGIINQNELDTLLLSNVSFGSGFFLMFVGWIGGYVRDRCSDYMFCLCSFFHSVVPVQAWESLPLQ